MFATNIEVQEFCAETDGSLRNKRLLIVPVAATHREFLTLPIQLLLMSIMHSLVHIVVFDNLVVDDLELRVLKVEAVLGALHLLLELSLNELETRVEFFLNRVEIADAVKVNLLEVFIRWFLNFNQFVDC